MDPELYDRVDLVSGVVLAYPHFRAVRIGGSLGGVVRLDVRRVAISGILTQGIDIDCDTSALGSRVVLDICDSVLSGAFNSVRAVDSSPASSVEIAVDRTIFERTEDPLTGGHLALEPHVTLSAQNCRFRNRGWGILHGRVKTSGIIPGNLMSPKWARIGNCHFEDSIITPVLTSRTGLTEIRNSTFLKGSSDDGYGNVVIACQNSTTISDCSFSGWAFIDGFDISDFGPHFPGGSNPPPGPWPIVSLVDCRFGGPRTGVLCRYAGSLWEFSGCLWTQQEAGAPVEVDQNVTVSLK